MRERTETQSRLVSAALFLAMVVGLIAGIGVAGGIAASLSGCTGVSLADEGSAEAPAQKVETTAVVTQRIADTAVTTGTIIADRSSAVAADAAGKVVAVYADRGQRVAQGEPLIKLDVRGAVLGAREARAQRAAVDSEARLASVECARSQSLFDKGAITRAQYDREIAACASAREQAAAAAARVNLADKAIGDGVVRAPYSGVVVERFVQVGEYVRPDTKLVSLVDPDPLRLELTVPESLIGQLAPGRAVRFTTSGLPGQSFAARIDVLGAAVDRTGRSLVVEAAVDSAAAAGQPGLLPGMFVTAYIEVGSRELPVVPRAALRRAGTSWRIFAVEGGALEERIVQLADSSAPESDRVALLRGVTAGERVVSRVGAELTDGLKVQ
jgi:membrane fusion protein, multidrug efflux system